MTTRMPDGGGAGTEERLHGTMEDAEVAFEIPPFGIAPDSRMIFVHPHFDEVRKGLLNMIHLDSGFGVVTGEVGSGKTTLLHRVIADLPPDFEVALIMNTCLKPDELLQSIADDLGIPSGPEPARPEMQRRQLLSAIGARLDVNFAAGRRTIIIIDEAQHLSDETLELARMLSNLKSESGKGVRFLIFGQEQLRERLLRPELAAFVSRVGAQYHLDPLSLAETEAYVRHRLVAGRPSQPVTLSDRAAICLHRASSGLPRRINIVAAHALTQCLTNHRLEINTKDVITAAKAVALPFDRRRRERHYSTAGAWILLLTLLGFTARQYIGNFGFPSSTGMIQPLSAAESAPITAGSIAVAELPPDVPIVIPPPADIPAAPAPLLVPAVATREEEKPADQTHQSRSLSGNMRGPDITRLQKRLAELGYFSEPPTDKFGRATAAAVLAFQRERGIPEKGVAGPRTFAALYGKDAAPPAAEVPRVREVAIAKEASPRLPGGTRRLSGNMRGPDVTLLQKRLAELGYFKETPTDKFGRATQAALQAFQRDRGLSERGAAGPQTYAALYGTAGNAEPVDAR